MTNKHAFLYFGDPATEVVVVTSHTPSDEFVPQDCTFTSEVSDITSHGASVTIRPSNPDTDYYWGVYNMTLIKSYCQNDEDGLSKLIDDRLAVIAEMLSKERGIEITVAKAAEMVTVKGDDSYVYTDFSPDTEYCVLAVGLDKKARHTTEIYIFEPFRTLKPGGETSEPFDCTIEVGSTADEGMSISVTPADK